MSSQGTIKKFFEDKGFGFVTPSDGGDDVFVHVKDNPDLENCGPGDEVFYDAQWDDRKNKFRGVNLTCPSGGSGGGGGGWGGGGKGGGKGGGYSPYGGKGGGKW